MDLYKRTSVYSGRIGDRSFGRGHMTVRRARKPDCRDQECKRFDGYLHTSNEAPAGETNNTGLQVVATLCGCGDGW